MNDGENVAEQRDHVARLPRARRRAAVRGIACGAALGLLSLTAGCIVNQKDEVAKYRRVLDGPQPVPQFDVQPGQPLSLEAALLLANRTDETLDSEGEDYLQALIDKERAFSAFLPTISLAPTYTWVDRTSAGGRHVTGDTPINGNYSVFNGFQDLSNLRRARYTANQRKALLMDLQQSVLLSVGQTYYQVLSDERSVVVLKNSVSVQNERLRDMQGRQSVGVARALDVAQTAAQAAATRVQLIQAENNVRTARALLALLTSAPVQDSPLADRLAVPPQLPPSDELVRDAQVTRQDIRAAEALIESARQSVQQAIGQWYPSVSLNLNYFLSRTTSSFATGGVVPAEGVWNGILTANLPIFTGGLIHANVRTAWSQLRQAWLNERLVRRQAAEQVQVAYENLEDSRRRITELRVEVSAAQEALRQAESNYSAGVGTNLDRLTAQDQLLSAQLSLVTEEINFKIYYLDLLRTEGRMPLPRTLGPAPGTPTSQPNATETVTPGPVRTAR
jgi:outer membrane protein